MVSLRGENSRALARVNFFRVSRLLKIATKYIIKYLEEKKLFRSR